MGILKDLFSFGRIKSDSRRKKLVPRQVVPQVNRDGVLRGFLAYSANECGLSVNTLDAYRRDMTVFFGWLGEREPAELTLSDFIDFMGFLRNTQKLAPSSCARHIVSLRSFYRFLLLEGHIQKNLTAVLDSPKLWDRIPSVLTVRQVERLMTAPVPEQDRLWQRDRAILEMFYATGCRVSEIAGMTLSDYRPQEGFCRCRGKGDKERLVPIGAGAIAACREWFPLREQILVSAGKLHQLVPVPAGGTAGTEGEEHLFLTKSGNPIRREALWELVKKYAVRVGAPVSISPHSLRHSFATHLLAGGADIRVVQELLGHASIQTTQQYTHVDFSRMKALHEKFHPRS